MTVLTGKISSFFTSYGASIATTAEGMTRVGSTNEFYITDRTKMWFDPEAAVVVKVGGSAVTVTQIDYAIGYVTLASYTTGTVTCDVSYFAMEGLGGGHNWKVDIKAETKEVTPFPMVLNTSVAYKQYVNTMMEFSGSVDRYWTVSNASWTDSQGTNKDLVWTWLDGGSIGNAEAIRYVVSGTNTVLEVAYASHEIVVTCATTGAGAADSTAAQIRTHALADPVIAALVSVEYATGQTGAGKPGAVSHTHLSGGRDSWEIAAKMAGKCLLIFYTDVTTSSRRYFAGVGNLSGMSQTAEVGGIVESNLTFSGSGRLVYHAEG